MAAYSDTSLVKIPRTLTPSMEKLTDMQRRFVVALVETGGRKVRAALLAGYGRGADGKQNYQSAAVAGSRLAHDPRVIAAVKEQAEQILQTGAVKAAAVMIELMDNVDPRTRYKAADRVLAGSGLQVVSKQEIAVTHEDLESKSVRELVSFIKAEAAKQNIDPRTLLTHQGIDPSIIDAEFEEVVQPSTEGLEDIL